MKLFENFDANDIPEENSLSSKKPKALKIGTEPIIAKLVPILNMKDNNGKPLLYFPYARFSFPMKRDGKALGNWTRPSLKVKDINDPQYDKYIELRNQMKTIADKKSVEYKTLDEQARVFAPSRKAIIYVHVMGSDDIQAMEISDTLRKRLFGSEAYGDRPAEEGLYQEMRRKGTNLFDVMASKNWLKFTRTGTTWNDTKYSVDLYKTPKVVDGEEGMFIASVEVSSYLKQLKDTDLPVAKEIAADYSWSLEEVNAYLNNGDLPDRLTGANRQNSQFVPTTPVVAAKTAAPSVTPEAEAKEEVRTQATKNVSSDDFLEDAFR